MPAGFRPSAGMGAAQHVLRVLLSATLVVGCENAPPGATSEQSPPSAAVAGDSVPAPLARIAARALPRAQPCEPVRDLPKESYWVRPRSAFSPSDYVAQFRHMEAFYDVPGELGYIAEGQRYGFESLSFIITETQPGGGPPLHVHETEEAHVLLEGEVEYVVGERRFRATGPYLARVPPGVAHTFANRGKCPFNLVAVFPDKRMSYKEIGPNPLVQPPAR